MRHRKILGLSLLVVASVLVVGAFAVMRNGDLNDVDRQFSSCPRGVPRFQVTLEDAKETLRSSYPTPENWFLHSEKMVKYCSSVDSWWSSQDGREWQEVPENEIPEPVRQYAVQSGQNKALYSITARHGPGLMTVDVGWVDGVSSQLVAKIRIAE